MNILITTPLSGGDVGGPSHYGHKLEEGLERLGHKVKLVNYRIEKRMPIGIRHVYFFLKIIPKAIWADAIITLDTFSVGVPSTLAGSLMGKKVIVRIGGDFLWESYINRTGESLTLKDFYEHLPNLNRKEKIIFSLTKILANRASVLVFNTDWFKQIWINPYRLDNRKAVVIHHPIPDKLISVIPKSKNFLWAGRVNKVKNTDRLKDVGQIVSSTNPDFRLDMVSNVPHQEVLERIRKCYAVILPSLSDTCPLFVIEAMTSGKPYIVTKETGLKEIFDKGGIFVDPLDVNDIRSAIEKILVFENYEHFVNDLDSFKLKRNWSDVANEFEALCL